jgi:hypothetical protein
LRFVIPFSERLPSLRARFQAHERLVRELLIANGMNKLSAFVIATVVSLSTFIAVGAATSRFSTDFVQVAITDGAQPATAHATYGRRPSCPSWRRRAVALKGARE